ncbi:MAG: YjbQ family protein [Planctomycetota bacterium]|jgi:thiamine phosphate synthase YjbQ (UPF0047 family)
MVKTKILEIPTKGNCHIVDITAAVQEAVAAAELTDGTVTVFNVGSTAGVTTIEYEPGLVNHDINTAFEKIARVLSITTSTPHLKRSPRSMLATNTKKPGTTTTATPM